MTVTEAARCGRPAVVTDVTGHRASVIDGITGDLVSRVADIPSAISRLLADDQRWHRYSSAAHERAHQMSWDTAAREHLDLLLEVSR
jgi:glycosyltransferase involved in cell wall biosynthesis